MIDHANPINWTHSFARGLLSWHRVLPGVSDGLYWRDLCNRSHATLTNMEPRSTTSGYRGTARPGGDGEVRFDGSNDQGIASLTATAWPNPIDWTMAAWGFPVAGTGFQGLCGWANAAAERRELFIDSSKIPGVSSGTDFRTATSGGAVLTGVWVHLAATYIEGVTNLYRNGVSLTLSTPSGATPRNQANTFFIGSLVVASSTFLWNGAADDVMVWQYGFPPEGIAALYQSSLLGHPGLLRRRVPRVYSVPAAPGGTGITSIPLAGRSGRLAGRGGLAA